MSKRTKLFNPTFARKIKIEMDKTVQLVFADITERATMLSAFEAKQAINTNGESMFSDVRIYDKDHDAINTYIREGAKLLEAQLASTFTVDATDDADPTTTPPTPATMIVWTFTDIDTRRTTLNADKFKEAIVCYVLSRWLENKIQNTAQAYTAMFKDLSDAAIKITKTKRKPARPQES
jgi:hypothetical protein